MSPHSILIRLLAEDTFSQEAFREIVTAASPPYRLELILNVDEGLGGASMLRLKQLITEKKFNIADRDVFRPLQYCEWGFKEFGIWDTRQIVYMSSLHIEALVKRISQQTRNPLGMALRQNRAKQLIAPATYEKIERLTKIYNSAKHDMDHEFGTHMFSQEDAIMFYFTARKLGLRLYELANLKTNIKYLRKIVA